MLCVSNEIARPGRRGDCTCACQGRLLELRAGVGWIVPLQIIEHPMAKWNKGHVYLDPKDVQRDAKLQSGDLVMFYLYADSKGLGAEECFAVNQSQPEEESSWNAWSSWNSSSHWEQDTNLWSDDANQQYQLVVPNPINLLDFYEDDEDESDDDDDFYGPSPVKTISMKSISTTSPKFKEDCSTTEGEDFLVTTGSSSEGSDEEFEKAPKIVKKAFHYPPGLPLAPGPLAKALSTSENNESEKLASPVKKNFRYPPGLPHVPGPVSSSAPKKPELTKPVPVKKALSNPPGMPLVPGLVNPGDIAPRAAPQRPMDIIEAPILKAGCYQVQVQEQEQGSPLPETQSVRSPPGLPHPPGPIVKAS